MMQGAFKSILVESIQELLSVLSEFFVCTAEEQTDKANDADKISNTVRKPGRGDLFIFFITFYSSAFNSNDNRTGMGMLLQRLKNFPMMTKGINHAPEPIAITLVGHRIDFSGAGMNGLACNLVRIFYL